MGKQRNRKKVINLDAELDTLEIKIKDNAKTTAKGIDKLTASLIALKAASEDGSGLEKFNEESEKLKNTFSNLKLGGSKISSLKSQLSFGALSAGLKSAYNQIGKLIAKSSQYIETVNLFNVAMGNYAKEAKNYADEVSAVMGIDPAVWMKSQAVIMTLTSGFGVVGDRAATMSKNLTQLGYDLSSFFNISVEDAMQKIQSGISGELEPLRRLGYDLSQAKLEAIALSLGIDKSVSSMTQAEKAELRYHAILTQVTTAQGDMARTLEQPANQLRLFEASINQASRAIGNIFIPLVNKMLPTAIAIVKTVEWVADSIAAIFGFKSADIDDTSLGGLADNITNIEDSLGGASSAAKELKRQVMGFDELNILTEQRSGGGGAGGVSGSGFEFPLKEYDFLGDAVSSKATKIFEDIKSVLVEIAELVPENTFEKLASAFSNLKNAWNNLKENPAWSVLGDFLKVIAASSYGTFLTQLANGFNLLSGGIEFFNSVTNGDVSGIFTSLDTIRTSIAGIFTDPIKIFSGNLNDFLNELIWGEEANVPDWVIKVQDFMENYFWPSLAPGSGGFGTVAINNVITKLGGLAGVWEQLKNAWQNTKDSWNSFKDWANTNFIEPLEVKFSGLWKNIKLKAEETWENIKLAFQPAIDWFSELFGNIKLTAQDIFYNIGVVATGAWNTVKLVWNKVSTWFNENVIYPISNIFSDMWKNITSKASDVWQGIKNVFNEAKTYFKNLFTDAWGKVVEVFSPVGETFTEIKEGVENVFKNVVNGLITGFNWVISWPFNKINSIIGTIKYANIAGFSPFKNLQYITVPQIPYLANGGYGIPNGQLFIANEAGPELVGQMNGRNTVANQEQIIEGIRQATYEGFMAAMANNSENGGESTFVFQVGEDTFATIATKAINKQTRELGYLALEGI